MIKMEKQQLKFSFDELLSSLSLEDNKNNDDLKKIFKSEGQINAEKALQSLDNVSRKDLQSINKIIRLIFFEANQNQFDQSFFTRESQIILMLKITNFLIDLLDKYYWYIFIVVWALVLITPLVFFDFILFLIIMKVISKFLIYIKDKLKDKQMKYREQYINSTYASLSDEVKELDISLVHLVYTALKTKDKAKNIVIKESFKKIFKQWEAFSKVDTVLSISNQWEDREDFNSMKMLTIKEIVEAQKNKTNLNHSLGLLFFMLKENNKIK